MLRETWEILRKDWESSEFEIKLIWVKIRGQRAGRNIFCPAPSDIDPKDLFVKIREALHYEIGIPHKIRRAPEFVLICNPGRSTTYYAYPSS